VTSQVLAEAERWGIATNVCKAVRPPRPERPELRIPDADETRTLLKVVKGSIAEGPTVLAAACGLRVGESCALQWRNVDLDRARLPIVATMYRGGRTEPKTAHSRRTVAIPGFAVAYLTDQQRAQAERRLASVAWSDGDYLFDAGGGIPLSVESVSRRFGQLAERVGLADVRLHDIRHAFRDSPAGARCPPEGRVRGTRPRVDRDYARYLQPRDADDVAGGRRRA
jgi:integrase